MHQRFDMIFYMFIFYKIKPQRPLDRWKTSYQRKAIVSMEMSKLERKLAVISQPTNC